MTNETRANVTDVHIHGTASWEDLAGSDVAIITAGVQRKAGMSRDDLLAINLKIIRGIADNLKAHCPDAFVIVVSNPLDAMVHEVKRVTGFPGSKVVGMAGILDSARFQLFLAREANVAVKDVRAMVLGGHGDSMVPVLSYCTINGIPVRQLITQDRLDAIIERTRDAGAEVVKLAGSSAYYAPASAAAQMMRSYLYDEKRLLPCACFLNGQYGFEGLYMGVPAVLGAGGVEKIVEVPLDLEARAQMQKTAGAILQDVQLMRDMKLL